MKKIVLATILVATTAVASAQVAITGKVSEWVDSNRVGATRTTSIAPEATSNFAIGVTEDLGGGLKARAVLETSLSGNTITGTGTQLGDRQGTVGLANKFGSLDLGRNVHSQFLSITNNDAFGTLYGSVAGDVHNLRGLRFSDAVFATVVPVKGVTLAVDRTQAVAGNDATAYSLNATVAGINATAARFQQGVEKSTVLGANAKFGATSVFYTHSNNESATAGETKKGDLVGLAQRVGSMTAKASYGKTNKDVKAYNVGLDYHLSKRTDVGVAYRNVDLVGSTADIKQIGVGLTHRF